MPLGVVIVVVGRLKSGGGDGVLLRRLLNACCSGTDGDADAPAAVVDTAECGGSGEYGGGYVFGDDADVGMPTIGFFFRRFILYVMMLFRLSCTTCERECSPPDSASRLPRRVITGSTGTTCILPLLLESPDGRRSCSEYCVRLCWLELCGMLAFCHEMFDPDRLSDELPIAADDDSDEGSDVVDAERRKFDTRSFTSNANAGWKSGSSAFTVPRPRLPLPLCGPNGDLPWNDAFRSTFAFGFVTRCLDDDDMDMVVVDGPHVDANDGWDEMVEPVGEMIGIS